MSLLLSLSLCKHVYLLYALVSTYTCFLVNKWLSKNGLLDLCEVFLNWPRIHPSCVGRLSVGGLKD